MFDNLVGLCLANISKVIESLGMILITFTIKKVMFIRDVRVAMKSLVPLTTHGFDLSDHHSAVLKLI